MSHAIRPLAVLWTVAIALSLVWNQHSSAQTHTSLAAQNGDRVRPIDANYRGQKSKPDFLDPRALLGQQDEADALDAIQQALMTTPDNGTYVWRPSHKRLNAVIQITRSFHDGDERICRHIVVLLNTGLYSRQAEGIACRLPSGLWSLSG